MISEQELAKLSYPEAPKMVTDKVPGPKTQKLLEDSSKYESMARGAGSFPCVYDEGLGATVKDPDGNLFLPDIRPSKKRRLEDIDSLGVLVPAYR